MFTVGKHYDFEFLDSYNDKGEVGITEYPGRKVVGVDGPLVKIDEGGKALIVNTHSPAFFRATEKLKT